MRLQNWPHLLAEYIRARQSVPFTWGSHDCAHFAASAVSAITGQYPEFPHYKTKRAALKLLAQKPLRERAGEILGPEIYVSLAQRGDVIMFVDLATGPALGICFGENSFFTTTAGLVPVLTLTCLCAWRIT